MSIKSELTKTASHLRNARKAILGRGGEISLTAGLKDLPDAIYKIPIDVSLSYQVDDSVKYEKVVPTNAYPYARINKIGGMSYKSENLLLPYRIGESETTNGVTITYNEDGSFTLNGTATDYTTFKLGDFSEPITVGVVYTWLNAKIEAYIEGYDEENGDFMLLDEGLTYERRGSSDEGWERLIYGNIFILSGATFDNVTVYLSISKNGYSTNYEYLPRFNGFRDAKVSELRSVGTNLFDINNVRVDSTRFTVEENSIVVTDGNNYNIDLFDGGIGSSRDFNLEYSDKLLYLTAGTYYVYFDMTSDDTTKTRSLSIYKVDKTTGDASVVKQCINGDTLTISESCYYTIRRTNQMVCTISNVMITRVENADYIPYKSDIFKIPEEVQAIEGYGRGVNADKHNYIDYERKVFVQNTYRKVFDGTESWIINETTSSLGTYRMSAKMPFAPAYISVKTVVQSINSHGYISRSAEGTYNGDEGVSFNASSCLIYDKNYNTKNVDAWKAHLAELYANGNPLIVEYALATPIETDISVYLTDDNFIEVEGGGTITAVNEYEYDAPSTINYITKAGT